MARKEDALKILRSEKPESGWTARTVLETMVEAKIVPESKLRTFTRANTKGAAQARTVAERLSHVREVLEEIKLDAEAPAGERTLVKAELARIHGEVKRLHAVASGVPKPKAEKANGRVPVPA